MEVEMKRSRNLCWLDVLVVVGIGGFFFGCIASSVRTAKTLHSGQASIGASYLRAEDAQSSGETPVQLLSLDGRIGITKGLDGGIMHTWDITQGNKNTYATIWGDVKWQLTNLDNSAGKPIISLGLMKGYVYDESAMFHVTTLPIMLSLPINDYVTPTLTYRHELIGKEFIPLSLEDPRSTWSLGAEINLTKPNQTKWIPKVGFAIGTFNSLMGGESGDRGLIFNIGLTVDSPWRSQ